jgi:hypothetical protein
MYICPISLNPPRGHSSFETKKLFFFRLRSINLEVLSVPNYDWFVTWDLFLSVIGISGSFINGKKGAKNLLTEIKNKTHLWHCLRRHQHGNSLMGGKKSCSRSIIVGLMKYQGNNAALDNSTHTLVPWQQGCQMVYFHTKNPNLGILWWALEWKTLIIYCHLEYFTAVRYICMNI